MAKNNGKYIKLELASVAGSSSKTITYLKSMLPQKCKGGRPTVIFLGEDHNSVVDQEVTTEMVLNPPYVEGLAPRNRLIFERGLDTKYPITSASFGTTRTENSALGTPNRGRSKVMAAMCVDAFTNLGVNIIYLPCGSKHAAEVFGDMDNTCNLAFNFVSKLDDAAYKA